jgi:plastocyanin
VAPGGGGATAAPAPTGEPGATAAPGGPVDAILEISAQNIAYDTDTLEAPADTPFQIVFANNDAGIPHNVEIKQNGQSVWFGDIFNGVETRTYDVPALPAGTYGFICTVHPNMTGTLTVR